MVKEIILAYDLNDIKPKVGRFTWSNNQVGSTNMSARLNRFLVHSNLLDGKAIISSKNLPKISSDHHPISLLFENEDDLGPIPFWFSPLWTERDGFLETIQQAWSHYVEGSPSFV